MRSGFREPLLLINSKDGEKIAPEKLNVKDIVNYVGTERIQPLSRVSWLPFPPLFACVTVYTRGYFIVHI